MPRRILPGNAGGNHGPGAIPTSGRAVLRSLPGRGDEWQAPLWVILTAAGAMGLGTVMGGWRIVRTMGLRVVELRPIDGFAAETAAATVIEVASRLDIPVSTTQVISSILGVGATRSLSAVRWGIAGRILSAWIITIPACIGLAGVVYSVLHLITGIL